VSWGIVGTICVTYYATRGREHVDQTLRLIKTRSAELGVRDVVIASTRGFTAAKALALFQGSNRNVVVVGTARERFPPDLLDRLTAKGYVVRFSHEVDYVYPDAVRDAYRRFSEGVKVAVEIAMIAADEGLVPVDRDIIAMGKWDTALVIKPAKSEQFAELRVRELLCKPR
jgi:hypothetical protein